MRLEIQRYINSKKDLKQFIREQPYWYRRLAREPNALEQFEITSMHYYKKTIPDHVERFSNGLQMASMMMGMLQSMKPGG